MHISVYVMGLEHAILVSLAEKSASGYELTRRFGRSIGFFWEATHQQIYRTLARMTETGWVTYDVIEQPDRPDKKVYRISNGGQAELARWLAEPLERPADRDGLAVKIRGASLGDLPAVISEIERHRAMHAERLETYRTIEKRDFPDPAALSGRALHQYLVLRGGIRTEQGRLDWCDEALEALRADNSPDQADTNRRSE